MERKIGKERAVVSTLPNGYHSTRVRCIWPFAQAVGKEHFVILEPCQKGISPANQDCTWVKEAR